MQSLPLGRRLTTVFYYDFDVEKPFTAEELTKIEAEMKKDRQGKRTARTVFISSRTRAINMLQEMDEPYKVELCEEHADKGEPISFYKQGDFTDLCAGPHLMSTGND